MAVTTASAKSSPSGKMYTRTVPARAAKPAKPTAATGRSFSLFNFIARLIAWYALYTVLFRCPTYPTKESPGLCHPAHSIKTYLKPYTQPIYETYISPYVHAYSPYVQQANKDYIIPAVTTVQESYKQHAEPYVIQGTEYAATEYSRLLKPHVVTAKEKAGDYLNLYVAPHASTIKQVYITNVKPKVEVGKDHVRIILADNIMPNYGKIQPYLASAYEQGKYVLLTVVAPVVKEGGDKALGWGRGVWSEVVQPQVGRIGERLGGMNGNSNAPASAMSSVIPTLTSSGAATDASSSISSMVSVASAAKESAGSDAPHKLTREEEREIINNDLIAWAEKFASSSERTLADLTVQINEISQNAITEKKGVVEKDITALKELCDAGLEDLKKQIITLASSVNEDSTTEEVTATEDKLFTATRNLGIKIRDAAQQLRKQAEEHLAVVYDKVSEAADQHLEILDGINEMGLQELGMKWAWMDYVSYKDWAKYHDFKSNVKESKGAIIKSAERNEKLLEFTKWVEEMWEGKVTVIAKEAAEELARLKGIGKRKIEMADGSDSFADDVIPVPVRKAGQQVLKASEKLKDAIIGQQVEDTVDEKETITEKILHAAEEVKEKIEEVVLQSTASTVTPTPVTESIASAASSASESIAAAIESITSAASEAVLGTPEPEPNAAEKVAEVVSEAAESVVSLATEATESIASLAAKVTEDVKKVPFGVYAGSTVKQEKIIFEDEASSIISSGSEFASQVAEGVKSQIMDASSVASAAVFGTPEPTPAHEMLLTQASLAYAHATSLAGDQLQSIQQLVATQLQPEEKPLRESLYSAASFHYTSALSAADAQYSALLSSASEAKRGLDEAIAGAISRQFEAAAAASTAEHRDNILSSAKEKYQQAVAEAKRGYDSWYAMASEQLYGTPTPALESLYISVASQVEAVASGIASSAEALTEARYEELKNLFNDLLGNQQLPLRESIRSRFEAVIYGTPEPFLSRLSASVVQATGAVASVASDASSAVSGAASDISSAASSVVSDAASVVSYAAAATSMPPSIDSLISDCIAKIKSAAHEASGMLHTTQPEKEQVLEKIQAIGEDAIMKVSEAIYGPSTSKGNLEKATSSVGSVVSVATEGAGKVVEGAGKVASSAAGAVVEGAGNAAENVASAASVVKESAAEILEAATESAASVVSVVKIEIVSLATAATDSAASMASVVSSGVSSVGHDAGVKLGLQEEEEIRYRDQLMENAKRRIEGAVRGAEEALMAVSGVVEEVGEIVGKKVGDVKEMVQSIKDEL